MTLVAAPNSYFKKFKFVVEIDGIPYAGFKKCSELSAEFAKIEHFEGGSITPHKSPGRLSFTDITLERGATMDLSLWGWFQTVGNAQANAGLKDPAFKRNLDIVQQDLDGESLMRYRVKGAWPNKFVAGEWDNDADENLITSVTLVIDSFIPIPVAAVG